MPKGSENLEDSAPSVDDIMLKENEAVESPGGQSSSSSVAASYPPVEPDKILYDPNRSAGDPFELTRANRLQARVLFPHSDELQSEYIERGNQEMAAKAKYLEDQLFNPKKGFLSRRTPDYSFRLSNLAKEERANRTAFSTLHNAKQELILGHQSHLALLEQEGLSLKLKDAADKQEYHDEMEQSLAEQMNKSAHARARIEPLEKKFLGLMSKMYTGLDHSLDGGTIFDTVDTTTAYNPETDKWETTRDLSGSGIAAVSVATLGVAANFLLTIASEGKVPMIADRLVFGIADRSLAKQKAKIEKYRDAGKSVNLLYGTLIGALENERAADNAYFAILYKRHEHEFGKRAATAESASLKHAYEILKQEASVKNLEYELGAKQALQSSVMQSIASERSSLSAAQTAQSQHKSDEYRRLETLRIQVAPPKELPAIAAKRGLDVKARVFTPVERENVNSFTTAMSYYTKAMVLLEDLEGTYGPADNWLESVLDKVRKKGNILYSEVTGEMTPEFALSHFGKLSAQKHGKESDTANQAVQEMLFWIERFYKGDEAPSSVKLKIADAMNQSMVNQAQNYILYKKSQSPKAIVLGEALMNSTSGAYESADEFAEVVLDPETRLDSWRNYYARMGASGNLEGYRQNVLRGLDRPLDEKAVK